MSDPSFPTDISAYKQVLDNTLSLRDSHGEVLRQARKRVVELEQRDNEIVGLARRLLKELPATEQSQYLRKLPWLSDGPDPASRQAVIVGVIQTFISNPSREFTAPEIELSLEA